MDYRTHDPLDCPLCGLPYAPTADICEECGQPLHSPPDFDAVRASMRVHKTRALYGGLGAIALLALNVLVFRGGGYVVVFAPISMLGWNWMRWRKLRAGLIRCGQLTAPA